MSPRQHKKRFSFKRLSWVLGFSIVIVTVYIINLNLTLNLDHDTTANSIELRQKTSFPASITVPKRRRLPNLSKGGIVLFYHMPKTAGSSIRVLAQKNEQMEWHSNCNEEEEGAGMEKYKKLIDDWTRNSTTILGGGGAGGEIEESGKVQFVEWHCDLDSFVSMKDDLAKWRRQADQNQIPFFVFTILRDPIDTYISIFNYFCIYLHKSKKVNCTALHGGPTGMLAICPDNPQVRWFCHGTTLDLGKQGGVNSIKSLDKCTAPHLLKLFNAHFDWIGQKGKLKYTSAIFQYMGIKKFGITHTNKVKGIKSFIKRKALNTTTIEAIREKVSLDYQIVKEALSTFTLEKLGVDYDNMIIDNI